MAQGDAEVVHGWALANVLRAWVDQWEHGQNPLRLPEFNARQKAASVGDFVTPIQWLAQETEIHERRIRAFVKNEKRFVGIGQADKVLTAIGKGDYLTNGEIDVFPNPVWSNETWRRYMVEKGCI